MTAVSTQNTQVQEPVPNGAWYGHGRQLGLGVLVAFTVKGVCTTAMIVFALFVAMDESGTEMFPHLLVWTGACIGGFCVLGWRRVRQRDEMARLPHAKRGIFPR